MDVSSPHTTLDLLDRVDAVRRAAATELDAHTRSAMGQFMTPAPVARFMASMFEARGTTIRMLDAGAGVGSLTAAFVAEICARPRARRPARLRVTAYELDPSLLTHLRATLNACQAECASVGIALEAHVHGEDFVEAASAALTTDLFSRRSAECYDCAILNPPYRKIHTSSRERAALRRIGVETSNLYTAFLALALKLLADPAEMVAITPRSFCNGPYFLPFRKLLLATARIRRVHVFERRDRAFAEDDVLQENIIFHAQRGGAAATPVLISSSHGPGAPNSSAREVDLGRLVSPTDPGLVIHIAPDQRDEQAAGRMTSLPCTLEGLGIEVSTGRVVDFRAGEFLRDEPAPGTAPLIYPAHFAAGFVAWPKLGGRKPNAVVDGACTSDLLIPNAVHVLVKRFSSKEERRRIVAAIHDPSRVPGERVGFENHLNYYHAQGRGLELTIAKGLAAFLNSGTVDDFFRQFSGHTQVNAADLRSLRYPSRAALASLGAHIGELMPAQAELDRLVESEVFAR
ncbi:MAG: Eco57I restriction-modification methylase domain-containing protein [Planctomycetes bacterium]|nr:Eco57I restriction-modification methylase domain-containing protein [Planctomycetota bacterium]